MGKFEKWMVAIVVGVILAILVAGLAQANLLLEGGLALLGGAVVTGLIILGVKLGWWAAVGALKGVAQKLLWAIVGLALAVIGTSVFWFHAHQGVLPFIGGFTLMIGGHLVWLLAVVGPFAGHGHHGGHDEDDDAEEHDHDEEMDETKFGPRASFATSCGALAVHWFYAVIVGWIFSQGSMENLEKNLGWAVGVFAALVIQQLWWDINDIAEEPPTKAQLTFLGRRLKGRVKDEGNRYFPMFKLLFGYVPQIVVQEHMDLGEDTSPANRPAVRVWTPDGIFSDLFTGFSFVPYNPLVYHDVGEAQRVASRYADETKQFLQEWASSRQVGPQTVEEMSRAHLLGINYLVRRFVPADSLPHIPGPVRTEVLLQYFDYPEDDGTPPEPPPSLKKVWGDNWERLESVLSKWNPAWKTVLGDMVRKRRKLLDRLARGAAYIKVPELGIAILQVNLKKIVPDERYVTAQAKRAIEEREREGDKVEIDNVGDRIAELAKKTGLSPDQARKVVQTERKKISETVNTHEYELGPRAAESLGEIVAKALSKLGGK